MAAQSVELSRAGGNVNAMEGHNESGDGSRITVLKDYSDYHNRMTGIVKNRRLLGRRECHCVSGRLGDVVVDLLEISSGSKKYCVEECRWEKPIRFGFVSSRNVLHFPSLVSKNFLEWNQKNITIVDSET